VRSVLAILSLSLLAAAPSREAVEEKERGDRLAANGERAAAREAYEHAVKLAPGYAAAINELGVLLANEGKLEEAATTLREATTADPTFALAHNNLGFVLRKLGRFGEAVEAYRAYVALEPADAGGQYGLAEAHRAAGNKAEAVAAYEQYVALEKAPAKQDRVEKVKGFIESLKAELRASGTPLPAATPAAASTEPAAVATSSPSPSSPVVVVMPATTAVETTPPQAAGATVAAPPAVSTATPAASSTSAPAVAVSPEKAALSRQRVVEGLELRSSGKTRESLFALQDAVNADPTNAQALYELGVAYAALHYYPPAIERWQRVLAMDVDPVTRGAALEQIEKARSLIAGAPAPVTSSASAPVTSSAPASPPATAAPGPEATAAYTQALERYREGMYADALLLFTRAIETTPDLPQAYSGRGSTHFALKKYNEALSDYIKAMQLNREIAAPIFGAAESLYALDRKADALRYYQAYAASTLPDVQPSLQKVARDRIAELLP